MSTSRTPGSSEPTCRSDVKVALLGTGLIGGSIGLALRRVLDVDSIVAYDRDPAIAARAVERGAADAAAPSPAGAVASADFVFIAAPVGAIATLAGRAAPGLGAGTLVTDVGSTKSRVVREVEPIIAASGASFIGGHPMAGTEDEGIEAASGALFEGAWWILTPTPRVDPSSYGRLHGLLAALGAHVLAVDPDQHDELLAIISHLPHLTAATLMNLALERGREHAGLLALAAGGFRDVTRVAASNPEIWLDICEENRAAISAILEEFAGRLLNLKGLVEAGDRGALNDLLLEARTGRRNLPGKRVSGELYEVLIPVPDRPGVLAEVTTLVGNLGINIEDLEITHGEEGGRGVLRLIVLGADEAHRVAGSLSQSGFEPRLISL